MWTVEVYEAETGTAPYERFIGELNDLKFARARCGRRARAGCPRFGAGPDGMVEGARRWVHEFRIRHQAGEITRMFGGDASKAGARRQNVLLRVFVHFHGDRVVLLLGGCDKGDDPKER